MRFLYSFFGKSTISILTWYREHRDQKGGLHRSRPFHCTSVWLKPAIAPNVSNSGTQFFCVGDCVRAIPCPFEIKYKIPPLLIMLSFIIFIKIFTFQRLIFRVLCFIVYLWTIYNIAGKYIVYLHI